MWRGPRFDRVEHVDIAELRSLIAHGKKPSARSFRLLGDVAVVRESAVGLVLSQGLSIRLAAEDLGMPYHAPHSWVRDQRRARRKTTIKAPQKTMVDARGRA